ncbi:hypothetical protein AKJ60_00080 [candidate division MSBL1 archaeon SCGC-AAA385M11]|nr:hypothetical protein AKJ60_00080 [candidate division MSBL1 archaeon SCGC-AAA385M11]
MQNVLKTSIPENFRLKYHSINRNTNNGLGWRYASDDFLPYFRKTAADISVRDSNRFKKAIKNLILLYGAACDDIRFTDKSQTFTLKIPYLDTILSGSTPRFLLVTRNPYAMIPRAVKKTALSKLTIPYEKKLKIACEHWNNSMLTALSDGENIPDRFQWVRFEDFLSNPEEKLQEICRFLELKYEPNMLPGANDKLPFGGIRDIKWYPLRTDLNTPYLKKITPQDISFIQNHCKDMIEKFNYTPEITT